MNWFVARTFAVVLMVLFSTVAQAQEVDCGALPGPSVGPEMDLTAVSKGDLEQHLASVELEESDLVAERGQAEDVIHSLGGEGGSIRQNQDDRAALQAETWRRIEVFAVPHEYKDRPDKIPQALEVARKKFAEDEAFRNKFMGRTFQVIGKEIDEGRATPELAQQFAGLCDEYTDLSAWDEAVRHENERLVRAQALVNPDCWEKLREQFAAAIQRLKTAINESGELDLVAVDGMVAKIQESDPAAAEDMRATKRFLVDQDAAGRDLLLQLEAYSKALANGWQAPPDDMMKELEEWSQQVDSVTVVHYNTVIRFMELAEETASAAYWQQQLGGRDPSPEQLQEYLEAKRQYSTAAHSITPDGQPHPFVGHDAFRDYAMADEEGKFDGTARIVRDIISNE